MSQPIQSYEEMMKKLKPLSVVLTRLSDEQVAKLKTFDDPNRMKDEKLIDSNYINTTNQDTQSDSEQAEDQEIEIELDISQAQSFQHSLLIGCNGKNQLLKEILEDDTKVYSCFFCKQASKGYTKAFIHFQLHIDYFPVQCSICDEANTDLDSFITHCKKMHPQLNKVKYIRKYNSNCANWIENYLNTQSSHSFSGSPRKYCPACDWIHLSTLDVNNPANDTKQTNDVKPMQILKHIHQHIQYKPFQCSKCRENGQDFRLHVLDNSVRKHLSSHHKELLDNLPGWKFFNKQFTIPSLDRFISHYLSIFGQKMPKKRYKSRKSKAESETMVPNSGNVQINDSSIASLNGQNCDSSKSMLSQALNNSSASILSAKPTVVHDMNGAASTVNQSIVNKIEAMTNPLLIYPSSDKINLIPFPVESTDLGIICIDPRVIACNDNDFKYVCVFCDEGKTFASKIEACIHYAIHLNYYPVNCLLCQSKFIDLSALILHYEKEHQKYENNLFHFLKEDEKIENWINDFLDFQKTHEFLGNVSVTYGDYCLVCKKLSKEDGMDMKCHKDDKSAIREHIHQHLHYFPYRCLICFHGQREIRFSSVNSCAVNHFSKVHNLISISSEDKFKLLAKTHEILNLDKLIDNEMFPNREQKSELPIRKNLKRKLDDLLEDEKIVDKSVPRPHCGISLIDKNKLRPNSPMKETGAQEPKSLDYVPNKITYKEPFLLCFHCHTKVLNASDLEFHHQSRHPKLTIASYLPTKMDVFTK